MRDTIRGHLIGKTKHLIRGVNQGGTDVVNVNMMNQKILITPMKEVAIAPVRDIAVEGLDMIMRVVNTNVMSLLG